MPLKVKSNSGLLFCEFANVWMKVYNGASLFIYLIKRLGKIKEKEDV